MWWVWNVWAIRTLKGLLLRSTLVTVSVMMVAPHRSLCFLHGGTHTSACCIARGEASLMAYAYCLRLHICNNIPEGCAQARG